MRTLIIGAGGHGQVVADILWRMHEQDASVTPIGFLDDNPMLTAGQFLDLPVLGTLGQLSEFPHDAVIVAIGDNKTRNDLFETLRGKGEQFTTACHPRAVVAPSVVLGPGCMVCAGVIVNPYALVGANVILNTGCTVDHHNQIGDHAHVAPGAHLGGEVKVGDGALVGIGATLMPRCRVGEWSVVGAGACVVDDVSAGITVVGVPARPVVR